MTALLLLLGAGIGGGAVLIVWGLRPVDRHARMVRPPRRGPGDQPVRLARAVAAGLLLALLTRWPVGVAGGLLFGYFAGDLLSGRSQRTAETDRAAAIASWTEMLRDSMGAAAGLEQAIVTTAGLAPPAIGPEIRALVTRLQHERLGPALVHLAEDLADPTADLVVSALTLAASGEAQDLGDLLGSLAGAARDGATMRLKVDASRARTRTSVRIISGVTLSMALLLVLLNRGYLAPFDSVAGQGVLLGVFACFGAALVWLASMGRFVAPERFLAADRTPAEDRWP